MSASVVHRSVFDFCSNDEALKGLKEVNLTNKQTLNPEPMPEGMYSFMKTNGSVILNPKDMHLTENKDTDRQRECSLVRDVSDKMICSACRCTFTNRDEQVNQFITLK